MRIALLSLAAAAMFWLPTPPAQARAVMPIPAVTLSSTVVPVASRCGTGRHYVKAHRNKKGQLVKGRCVRNRVVR